MAKNQFNENFTANINYTYLNMVDSDTGNQLKPNHKFGLGLMYLNQFGVNSDDLTIDLEGYMVAGRPDNLDNYYLFDANIARDFTINKEKSQKVKLSLSVKNIFDERPELVSGYPLQGRTFLLGISTDF
jgi:outer membrane receptor protein involved in Fe transport